MTTRPQEDSPNSTSRPQQKSSTRRNNGGIKRILSDYLSDMPLNAWHLETRIMAPSPTSNNDQQQQQQYYYRPQQRTRSIQKRDNTSLRDLKFCFLVACIWTLTFVGLAEFVSNWVTVVAEEEPPTNSFKSLLVSFRESERERLIARRTHSAHLRIHSQQDSETPATIHPRNHHDKEKQGDSKDDDDNDNDHGDNASSSDSSNKSSNNNHNRIPTPPQRLWVDISYVNMTTTDDGYSRQHPHMGAKDEHGQWGYIHDTTALRRHPPPPLAGYGLRHNESTFYEACAIHDANYKMIHENVHVHNEEASDIEHQQQQVSSTTSKRTKVLCIVYTTERSHADKIPPIRETWGPKCDGFMVASTKTNVSLGTVEIPHAGDEAYENIWQKIRSVWSYVYDQYYKDYDWFHIGGEDMFVIPENLRLYLESDEIVAAAAGRVLNNKNINNNHRSRTGGDNTKYMDENNSNHQSTSNPVWQVPLFLGGRLAFEGDKNTIFNQGGGGYTLNKAALKMLVVEGIPNHYTHEETFTEDVMIAKVFAKLGIYPYDTRDALGGERYHPYPPGFHYDFRKPQGKYHHKKWYAAYLLEEEGNEYIEGVHHCAPHSISFHYIKVDLMYRLFALLYHLCPEESEPQIDLGSSNEDMNSMAL